MFTICQVRFSKLFNAATKSSLPWIIVHLCYALSVDTLNDYGMMCFDNLLCLAIVRLGRGGIGVSVCMHTLSD